MRRIAPLVAAALICIAGVSAARALGVGRATAAATTTNSVLLGDPTIEATADDDAAGSAEAFPFTSSNSGSASSITVYVDAGNRAGTLDAGLYADSNGKPGALLASGSIAAPVAASWNTASIATTAVQAGTKYWISILGLGGSLAFRDRAAGSCASESSSQANLSGLPATWSAGSTWNACPASAYVGGTPAPPANTAAPAVSGSPVQGQTLTTSPGSWSGSPTSYGYVWADCDSAGASCAGIAGATSSSYTLTSSDVGHTIRSLVVAKNAGGSGAAVSNATSPVTVPAAPSPPGSAPTNTAEPVVSGTVATGDALTTTTGTWTGSPTSYSYQWQDCATDGTACARIPGATASTYTVQAGDAGHTIEAVVTATNASGSASADANIVPLVDEFSSTGVDQNVWAVLDQQGDTSNDEQQCYEPSQVSEGSGALTIGNAYVAAGFTCPSGTPSNAACSGACAATTKHYMSGAVEETYTAFTYGTVVVRAKMFGNAHSTWPAIWLLGARCQRSFTAPYTWLSGSPNVAAGYYCPWPADSSDSAEIDVAEGDTGNTTTVLENLYNSGAGISDACASPAISDYSANFHTYEVDWSPGSLVFKIDGKATGCGLTGSGVPSQPMFLIIDGADQVSPNSAEFPDGMTVDYVHVSH